MIKLVLDRNIENHTTVSKLFVQEFLVSSVCKKAFKKQVCKKYKYKRTMNAVS